MGYSIRNLLTVLIEEMESLQFSMVSITMNYTILMRQSPKITLKMKRFEGRIFSCTAVSNIRLGY